MLIFGWHQGRIERRGHVTLIEPNESIKIQTQKKNVTKNSAGSRGQEVKSWPAVNKQKVTKNSGPEFSLEQSGQEKVIEIAAW